MSLLEKIETTPRMLPNRILLYGTPGIGCSTFAAGAEHALFIPTQQELHHLDCHRLPRCRRFGDLMQALQDLYDDIHIYQTVVIDTLEGLEGLIAEEICRERGLESIEEILFGKEHVLALSYWRQVLAALDALRCDFEMSVILVGHAQSEAYDFETGMRCQRYAPALHWRANLLLQSWCDQVLFATYDLTKRGAAKTTSASISAANNVRHEASDGRVIYTTPSAHWVAKNHLNLPPVIPMDRALCARLIDVGLPQHSTPQGASHG